MKKVSLVLVYCLFMALDARAVNPLDSIKQKLSRFEMPKFTMQLPKFQWPQKNNSEIKLEAHDEIAFVYDPKTKFIQAKLSASKSEEALPEPDYSKLKIKPEQIEGQITYAAQAGSADKASFADRAANADHALKSDSAGKADFATSAEFATQAISADSAAKADYATKAQNAETADYSKKSAHAETAARLIDGEISVSSDNLEIDKLTAKAFVKQLVLESQASSKLDKLLSLEPQILVPRSANAGDIYLYQEMGQLALCVYSPANTWQTLAGPVVCPAS